GGFKVIDIYNSLEFKPLDMLPWMKVYFDFARNTNNHAPAVTTPPAFTAGKGDNADDAWALGYKIGDAKLKGQWEASYAYKYIGLNATPSFDDSDFGFTGRAGNVLTFGYAITDYLKASMNAFFDNNLNHDSTLRDQYEKRFFWDLVWSF